MAGEAEEPWVLQHAHWVVAAGAVVVAGLVALAMIAGTNGWWTASTTEITTDADGEVVNMVTTTDRSAARDPLLRGATGAAAIVAGALAWGRLELSRREHRLARAAGERAVEAQITDRYARAVEQLGSSDTAVRLGALYALERLAHDSPNDRDTIYDVICAYIRHHSIQRDEYQRPVLDDVEGLIVPVDGRAVDYRAALDIVLREREPREYEVPQLRDLTGAVVNDRTIVRTPLTEMDLSGATLTHVTFEECSLDRVNFHGADLEKVEFDDTLLGPAVTFDEATLSDVTFQLGTSLERVRFRNGARLTNVKFVATSLTRVDFMYNVTLTDVHFTKETSLTDVMFFAVLTDVIFELATLSGCGFSGSTLHRLWLPEGETPGDEFEKRPDGAWYSRAEHDETGAASKEQPS